VTPLICARTHERRLSPSREASGLSLTGKIAQATVRPVDGACGRARRSYKLWPVTFSLHSALYQPCQSERLIFPGAIHGDAAVRAALETHVRVIHSGLQQLVHGPTSRCIPLNDREDDDAAAGGRLMRALDP
jgi:hypothetical protein